MFKKNNIERVLKLSKFPIKMGITDQNIRKDMFADMVFNIDKDTGIIFLDELISPEILYSDAHYNNIAQNWMEHHNAFAKFVHKYHPTSVFEIGGGTGILSCCYEKLDSIKWTILESAPNPIEGCKSQYEKGLFDENYKIKGNYDAIIHTHTMEHFYNPVNVIKNISESMKNGSYMLFSIPNLEEIYMRKYTNVLNFEHWWYCAEPYVTDILNMSGFEVIERVLFKEDHSVFYAAKKVGNVNRNTNYNGCYENNKKMLLDWYEYHSNLIRNINIFLEIYSNHPVYLFGAHVFSQYLISFGLDIENIKGVIDNDSSKQGHRLYGTSYKVYSSDVLINEDRPVIILHAGTHNEEIKMGILKKNSTAIFI